MTPSGRAAAALGLSCRDRTETDAAFLARVFASAREDAAIIAAWPEPLRGAFLAQQQKAQEQHFRHQYPGGAWLIVERSGEPVGRLYLDEDPDRLWIIDIALLPAHRGCGLGAALLSDILEEARATNRRVGLTVSKTNQARRLYERLGFTFVAEVGVYDEMEWAPPGGAAPPT